MKVLLLSSTNSVTNGYGNITHELCCYFSDKLDFTLLLPKSQKRANTAATYNIDYVLPDYIFRLKSRQLLKYLFFNYPGQPDIIHSLFEFPYALLAQKLANRKNAKLVIGAQGTYAVKPLTLWPESFFVKSAYRAADALVATSAYTRDSILNLCSVSRPVRIIHNGVNFARFTTPRDTAAIRQVYPGKKLLLTVGALRRRKGQDIVLRALALVKQQRTDWHYLIVGLGDQQATLKQIVADQGLEEFVTFMGERSGQEMVGIFQASDIYIHTARLTRGNFEGFGIVYLEASACRKPIIAARSGGVPDAVIDGQTGLIVPENDPEATSQAILRLLENPDLATTLGEAGYRYAQQHDWSVIGKQWLDLYQQLLSK
ncbi:MAG: glycosyltransferase family 4 protein [Candidatus Komeilibacteria bacterium]